MVTHCHIVDVALPSHPTFPIYFHDLMRGVTVLLANCNRWCHKSDWNVGFQWLARLKYYLNLNPYYPSSVLSYDSFPWYSSSTSLAAEPYETILLSLDVSSSMMHNFCNICSLPSSRFSVSRNRISRVQYWILSHAFEEPDRDASYSHLFLS